MNLISLLGFRLLLGVYGSFKTMIFHQTNLTGSAIVLLMLRIIKVVRIHQKVHKPLSSLCWKPPPCGMWKLKFDGAIICALNQSGVGAILRDGRGDMIMAMSRKLRRGYLCGG